MFAQSRLPTTRRTALAAVAALALAACATHGSAAPTASSGVIAPALADVDVVTAVGDSVPYGSACNCTPYPELSSADLATLGDEDVETLNDAVPGDTTAEVLTDLRRDQTTMSHVGEAGVVLVQVGANDIAYSTQCGTDEACYEPDMSNAVANLHAIVVRIRELAGGRTMAIVLLDYWNVWLGGQYATAQGPDYEHTAAALTQHLNAQIRSIAAATRSAYVDVRAAFRGPDDAWDETNLLAGDGDHPNAAGHARIAAALTRVLTTVLPR